uniref:Uncharacterized protein n=1 Tax=Leersia perrieri TaxID=77586 RepID=A0A0D9XI22_9ORYZ
MTRQRIEGMTAPVSCKETLDWDLAAARENATAACPSRMDKNAAASGVDGVARVRRQTSQFGRTQPVLASQVGAGIMAKIDGNCTAMTGEFFDDATTIGRGGQEKDPTARISSHSVPFSPALASSMEGHQLHPLADHEYDEEDITPHGSNLPVLTLR